MFTVQAAGALGVGARVQLAEVLRDLCYIFDVSKKAERTHEPHFDPIRLVTFVILMLIVRSLPRLCPCKNHIPCCWLRVYNVMCYIVLSDVMALVAMWGRVGTSNIT